MKERSIELVQGFRHSVPYINAHRGKTFVVMLDGEAIKHENFPSIVNDIGLLHSLGIRLVVVYGARPQIDNNLALHHYQPIYHKHTRVTDALTLEWVKQAADLLQLDITAQLSMSLNNTPLQGAHINVVSGNFTSPNLSASMTALIIAIAGVSAVLMKRLSTTNLPTTPSC